jgi:hypothetical protein
VSLLTNLRGWVGWWALILIAIAIGLAQFLGGISLIRRALWIFAAFVAVVAAVNEWRQK